MISWDFMGFHGASWGFMGLHGASWGFMGYHGISCDFMGLFCSFFVFLVSQKNIWRHQKNQIYKRSRALQLNPFPHQNLWRSHEKKTFQRPRALQPNPFPHQNLWRSHEKNPFKDPGLSSPIHSLTKNFWRSHEKKPFQRPRALQPNPFPHQKIFGGPRKTKLFKRHSLTKNFWRSHEKNPFKDPGLSSPTHSLTKKFLEVPGKQNSLKGIPSPKIFGGPRKTKLLKRPRAFQPNPFPHQKSQGFPAQSIPSPIPSHAIFASHFFCVVSRSKIPQAFAAELPKEATYSSLLTVPLLFF